jgi:hypothetical protein
MLMSCHLCFAIISYLITSYTSPVRDIKVRRVSETAHGQRTIRHKGPAIWNKLPDYLPEACSVYTFRNKFKILGTAQIV